MGATWSFVKRGDNLLRYVSTIKKEHHPRLRDNRLVVLWRTDADFGHIAHTMVVPPLFRFLAQTDAIMQVNKHAWDNMLNEQQKAYYIDTALTMVFASEKVADDGRPKLVAVQQEKVGFASVIKRHGMVTKDLEQYKDAFVETLQLDFWSLLQEASVHPDSFLYSGFNSNDDLAEQKFGAMFGSTRDNEMELFLKASRLVMEENKASALLLQLHLNIPYYLASMLMDSLIEAKFIKPFDADKGGHEVLVTEEMLALWVDAEQDDEEHEDEEGETGVEPHVMQATGSDNVVAFPQQ